MSSTRTVTCPSGMIAEVRAMKVSEQRLLTDQSLMRSGRFTSRLLAEVVSVSDPGPYSSIMHGDKLDWSKALQGDRYVLMVEARKATHGSNMEWKHRCPSCRATSITRFNLDDLEIKKIPEESLRKFVAKEIFSGEVAGVTFTFGLQTGHHEELAADLRKRKGAAEVESAPMTSAFTIRLSVDGWSKAKLEAWIEDLSWGDALEIQRILDAADFGVDTSIEVSCRECLAVQEMELPFGKEFWLPRT
jgi:hypothetical protein